MTDKNKEDNIVNQIRNREINLKKLEGELRSREEEINRESRRNQRTIEKERERDEYESRRIYMEGMQSASVERMQEERYHMRERSERETSFKREMRE